MEFEILPSSGSRLADTDLEYKAFVLNIAGLTPGWVLNALKLGGQVRADVAAAARIEERHVMVQVIISIDWPFQLS